MGNVTDKVENKTSNEGLRVSFSNNGSVKNRCSKSKSTDRTESTCVGETSFTVIREQTRAWINQKPECSNFAKHLLKERYTFGSNDDDTKLLHLEDKSIKKLYHKNRHQ